MNKLNLYNLCSLIVTSVETSSDIINQATHITGNSKQLIASSTTSSELLL